MLYNDKFRFTCDNKIGGISNVLTRTWAEAQLISLSVGANGSTSSLLIRPDAIYSSSIVVNGATAAARLIKSELQLTFFGVK